MTDRFHECFKLSKVGGGIPKLGEGTGGTPIRGPPFKIQPRAPSCLNPALDMTLSDDRGEKHC